MTDTHAPLLELQRLLAAFLEGRCISREYADAMGVLLDDAFPDTDSRNDDMQDLVLALASYQPGGGEYLYDYSRIQPLASWAHQRITELLDAPPER